jgi:hypothetical protein
VHRNAWTVLGDQNKFAISRHAGAPVPTIGRVVFKGDWEIEGDKGRRRFNTQSEAADTLLSETLPSEVTAHDARRSGWQQGR